MIGDGTLPFPIARVVEQRRTNDCGVSALAMLLRLTYDEVWAAMEAAGVDCRRGIWHRGMARIAHQLGRQLARQRTYDPEKVHGIAHMHFDQLGRGHYVLVSYGVVIDPADGQVWRWRDYLAAKGCSPRSILVGAGFGGEELLTTHSTNPND